MNLTKDWLFSFNQYFLGSMKRLLKLTDHEPPAKKTSTETEAFDRVDDGGQSDTKLDLVYPFTDASGGGTGGGGSVVPSISASRPLYMNNNILSLQYVSPLVDNGGLALNVDTAIFTTRDMLGLKLSPSGGLGSTESGLLIAVQAPLTVSSSGIRISTNNTMLSDATGLGVRISPNSVLRTENGLDVAFDIKTLQNTNNQLNVKLDPSGAIVPSSNGLFLQVNTDDFVVENKTLNLKSKPTYISPFKTYEVGNKGLVNASGQACSNQSGSHMIWNVAYYIFMVESAGLVNGKIVLSMLDSNVSGSGSSYPDGLHFSFVISLDGTKNQPTNLSFIAAPTVTPPDSNASFYPVEYGNDYIGLPPSTSNSNWYKPISTSGMSVTKFYPFGTGTTFGESSMGIAPATVQTVREYERSINGYVLITTFDIKQTSSEDWFNSNAGKKMTTGALSFSYQASG